MRNITRSASSPTSHRVRRFVLLFPVFLAISFVSDGKRREGEGRAPLCFDGGMMVHTGYLAGNIAPLNYRASGMPFGVGGVVHFHLGKHFRIGGEGYVSTLRQLGNGSYIKYGWGGVLGDFHWTLGRWMPYLGLTLGGGSNKDFLLTGTLDDHWKISGDAFFRTVSFFLTDPFIGCDYALTDSIHLTLKADCMLPVGRDLHIPIGPRLYFGILFFHGR